MRSADQLTALIQRFVTQLTVCEYEICGAARSAVDLRVPCCSGEGCGGWSVTATIVRHWPAGKFPSVVDTDKCSYIPAYSIEVVVARCAPFDIDNAELPDDTLAAEVLDVLDCLRSVYSCEAKNVMGWRELQFVDATRVASGVCVGWKFRINAAWSLG